MLHSRSLNVFIIFYRHVLPILEISIIESDLGQIKFLLFPLRVLSSTVTWRQGTYCSLVRCNSWKTNDCRGQVGDRNDPSWSNGVGKGTCALEKACLTERRKLKTLKLMYNMNLDIHVNAENNVWVKMVLF